MSFTERDNTEKLKAFKARVKSNLIEHYDDPKDIKAAVHTAIASLVSKRDLTGWVRADEIVNNSPILAELKKMSDELTSIKNSTVQSEEYLSPIDKPDDFDFNQIYMILSRTKVSLPYGNSSNKNVSNFSLADYFTKYIDYFVNGITKDDFGSDFENFLCDTVCPRLFIHGLLTSQDIDSGKYRRYNLAEKGRLFFIECEKHQL